MSPLRMILRPQGWKGIFSFVTWMLPATQCGTWAQGGYRHTPGWIRLPISMGTRQGETGGVFMWGASWAMWAIEHRDMDMKLQE